jgi:hypothetical protein
MREVVEKGEVGERNGGEMLYFQEYEYIFSVKNKKNIEKQERKIAFLRIRLTVIERTWKIR